MVNLSSFSGYPRYTCYRILQNCLPSCLPSALGCVSLNANHNNILNTINSRGFRTLNQHDQRCKNISSGNYLLSFQRCEDYRQLFGRRPELFGTQYTSRFRPITISTQRLAKQEDIMNVFDRKTKRLQRNRTALLKDYEVFDYLKEEIGFRMVDRMGDIKRKFDVVVELGCGRGHISRHVTNEMAELWCQCDMAEKVLAQSVGSPEVPTLKLHIDEEFLPFAENSVDLFISSLSLHWVNDLPGCFRQIHSALKKDGVFLAAMFGGETLYQLRVALQLAESELEGGISAHVSPFTDVTDLGNLLTRANFNMITMDIDELTVSYPTMMDLMKDLKGMGENNCAWNRRLRIPKKTLDKADSIYKEMYGNEDGTIPASFQVLYLIGWKPDPSQAKAAKRGSGEVSLKELERVDQLAKEIKNLRNPHEKN